MNASLVKVIDKNTKSILYTCTIENLDSAFENANNYENLGLEVEVITPTVFDTFFTSSKEEIEAEINSHKSLGQNDSCCTTDKSTDK